MNSLVTAALVLIPVFYNGPGQYNSEWFTAVNIYNRTSERVPGNGVRFINRACAALEGCETADIDVNAWGSVAGPSLQGGFFLNVPSTQEEKFEIDARFGERTRNTYGVELPIARENDFRRTTVVLPYVIMSGFSQRLRTTLRVYSPDAISGQQVRVDLTNFGSTTVRATQTLTLQPLDPPGSVQPLQPAYAQIDLQSAFPSYLGAITSVRVTPIATEGVTPRIWAFATAVRNDNNEVAVYSPR
jgi:hypothetical protein